MRNLTDLRTHPNFAAIRENVEKAGSDHLGVFGGAYQGGYWIQQNPDEFAAFACFLQERNRPIEVYGEIGVAAGGTTRLIHETIGFARAVLIDNGKHPNHRYFPQNVTAFSPKCSLCIGDSHGPEVAEMLQYYMQNARFDVAVVDGDHSYAGVKQDIELVRPYCTPATLVILHDTVACPGVAQAFAEMPVRIAEFVSEDKRLGIGVGRFM